MYHHIMWSVYGKEQNRRIKMKNRNIINEIESKTIKQKAKKGILYLKLI